MKDDSLLFKHRGTLQTLVAVPVVVAALQGVPAQGWEIGLGAAILAAAVFMRLLAIRWIGKRARVAHAGAAELLASGPYARTRNPIYVANLSILLGGAVLAGLGPWSLLVWAIGWGVYHLVVRVEEGALGQLFGESYKTYCARVPRWIPLIRAAEPFGPQPELWPWSTVLVRELPAVLGTLALFGGMAWVRLDGPFAKDLLALLDRIASTVGLTRSWLLSISIVAVAFVEGLTTFMKRRRHAIVRAQLQAAAAGQPSAQGLPDKV
jgi:protein-S-isoprenylcysteine O-methyltransferase Ste14